MSAQSATAAALDASMDHHHGSSSFRTRNYQACSQDVEKSSYGAPRNFSGNYCDDAESYRVSRGSNRGPRAKGRGRGAPFGGYRGAKRPPAGVVDHQFTQPYAATQSSRPAAIAAADLLTADNFPSFERESSASVKSIPVPVKGAAKACNYDTESSTGSASVGSVGAAPDFRRNGNCAKASPSASGKAPTASVWGSKKSFAEVVKSGMGAECVEPAPSLTSGSSTTDEYPELVKVLPDVSAPVGFSAMERRDSAESRNPAELNEKIDAQTSTKATALVGAVATLHISAETQTDGSRAAVVAAHHASPGRISGVVEHAPSTPVQSPTPPFEASDDGLMDDKRGGDSRVADTIQEPCRTSMENGIRSPTSVSNADDVKPPYRTMRGRGRRGGGINRGDGTLKRSTGTVPTSTVSFGSSIASSNAGVPTGIHASPSPASPPYLTGGEAQASTGHWSPYAMAPTVFYPATTTYRPTQTAYDTQRVSPTLLATQPRIIGMPPVFYGSPPIPSSYPLAAAPQNVPQRLVPTHAAMPTVSPDPGRHAPMVNSIGAPVPGSNGMNGRAVPNASSHRSETYAEPSAVPLAVAGAPRQGFALMAHAMPQLTTAAGERRQGKWTQPGAFRTVLISNRVAGSIMGYGGETAKRIMAESNVQFNLDKQRGNRPIVLPNGVTILYRLLELNGRPPAAMVPVNNFTNDYSDVHNTFTAGAPEAIDQLLCEIQQAHPEDPIIPLADMSSMHTALSRHQPTRSYPIPTQSTHLDIDYDHGTAELRSAQLQLELNDQYTAYVTHVESAGVVYVQLREHPSFASLDSLLHALYDILIHHGKGTVALRDILPRIVFACLQQNSVARIQVVEVPDAQFKTVTVRNVDDGRRMTVPCHTLRRLDQQRFVDALPFQAVRCHLCNVEPADDADTWSDRATEFVRRTVLNRNVRVRCVEIDEETKVPRVLLYVAPELSPSNGVEKLSMINNELVWQKHARKAKARPPSAAAIGGTTYFNNHPSASSDSTPHTDADRHKESTDSQPSLVANALSATASRQTVASSNADSKADRGRKPSDASSRSSGRGSSARGSDLGGEDSSSTRTHTAQ